MKGLYFECDSGISGDMTVGALLDLGASEIALIEGLKSLSIYGFRIEIEKKWKRNIEVCDYNVILEGHPKGNRNIYDIFKIIEQSLISENAKEISKRIFNIKAEAGAKAHNVSVDKFYFHEPGALDSIADIVGAAICFDNLNVKEVINLRVNDGCGYIKCKDKILSVPVPATKLISQKYNLNLVSTNEKGEMVTPTGASILAGIKTMDFLPENYIVEKVGFGNGKRNYTNGSILKVSLISW